MCHLGSGVPRGMGPRLAAAAGASLQEFLPMNCIEFGAFRLGLAVTLMGNAALYLWGVFPYFSKIESGRCQCESSHTGLRSVQLSTQRKTM